jgi:hypothetical protein
MPINHHVAKPFQFANLFRPPGWWWNTFSDIGNLREQLAFKYYALFVTVFAFNH